MNHKKNLYIFSLLLLAAVLLSACSPVSKRIGWFCINPKNELDCKYQFFTGQESKRISMQKNETLAITLDVEAESGDLRVFLQNPENETVWETDFNQTASDAFKVQAEDNGLYRLVVKGSETSGSFIIKWQILD